MTNRHCGRDIDVFLGCSGCQGSAGIVFVRTSLECRASDDEGFGQFEDDCRLHEICPRYLHATTNIISYFEHALRFPIREFPQDTCLDVMCLLHRIYIEARRPFLEEGDKEHFSAIIPSSATFFSHVSRTRFEARPHSPSSARPTTQSTMPSARSRTPGIEAKKKLNVRVGPPPLCCNKVKISSCKRSMIHAKFMRIRLLPISPPPPLPPPPLPLLLPSSPSPSLPRLRFLHPSPPP